MVPKRQASIDDLGAAAKLKPARPACEWRGAAVPESRRSRSRWPAAASEKDGRPALPGRATAAFGRGSVYNILTRRVRHEKLALK